MVVKRTFFAGAIRSHLLSVRAFVRPVEVDPVTFRPAEFDQLRDAIINYGRAELAQLMENFVEIELVARRGLQKHQVPAIFQALRNRFQQHFDQRVRLAFRTAEEAARVAQQQRNAGKQVQGFVVRSKRGRLRIRIESYLKLLFKTVPMNLERDLMEFAVRFFDDQPRFLVTGGIVNNSASTCRFCNDRVFTKRALDFVRESKVLRVHLFHPNCRHSIRSVSSEFVGKVFDLVDLPAISNGHFSGFDK